MKVAVVGGGKSSERNVSLASAQSVRAGLIQVGHTVTNVTVGDDGVWRLDDGSEIELKPGHGCLGVDVVFPVLHGPFGEDGTVQGLLECLSVPYVGSGVFSSALCMNKPAFKAHIAALGLPQVKYQAFFHTEWERDQAGVLARLAALGLPVFVKPGCLGSSIGMSKVVSLDALATAVDLAFAHDSSVVVEAAASGIEVECAVLGDRFGGIQVSEPGEITYAADWYDYHTKYTPGAMNLIVPARISEFARAEVQRLTVAVFESAECDGLARIDCFVNGDEVLVSELNTLPGFTETSLYGSLFAATGIPYHELLDKLVQLGLERYKRTQNYAF